MESALAQAKNQLMGGGLASAEALYEEILEKNPSCVEALHGLSLCLFQQGKWVDAKKILEKALCLSPEEGELIFSLAIVCQHLGLWSDAAAAFLEARKSLKAEGDPIKSQRASLMLVDIYLRQMKYAEAKAILKEILDGEPGHRDALKMLAQAYVGLGKYNLAIRTLEKIVSEPVALETFKTEVFLIKRDFRNAEKHAARCVELDPGRANFYNILGYCQIKTLKLNEAVASFKKGLSLDPEHPEMLGRLLAMQVRVCEWEERPGVIERLRRLCAEDEEGAYLRAIHPTIAILTGFSNPELLRVASAHAASIERNMAPIRQHLNFTYERARSGKLRIAYISSDFHNHATLHLMLEVFRLHDRNKFEVYAYSYGVKDRGPYRRRVEADCDRFFDVGEESDVEIAKRIHGDKIDILIDLKGHISDHRLGILALRPAPVQLHYLGYPGTIGASFIDYLIVDPYVVPKEERMHYAEKLVYMPLTYQANTNQKLVRKRGVKRSDYGIPEDVFVYCCFNQNDKFDPDSVRSWMAILKRVPGSWLWLWGNWQELKEKIESYAEKLGIDPGRIVVSPAEPVAKHLARIALADLFLDTFCYSAHTSCSDAIWMGLPVLTLSGSTFASRVAASLLTIVGAGELVVHSREEYIEKAVFFANHPSVLQRIRSDILKHKDSSGLYDPVSFTHALDEAYLKIWKDYREGGSAREIRILK